MLRAEWSSQIRTSCIRAPECHPSIPCPNSYCFERVASRSRRQARAWGVTALSWTRQSPAHRRMTPHVLGLSGGWATYDALCGARRHAEPDRRSREASLLSGVPLRGDVPVATDRRRRRYRRLAEDGQRPDAIVLVDQRSAPLSKGEAPKKSAGSLRLWSTGLALCSGVKTRIGPFAIQKFEVGIRRPASGCSSGSKGMSARGRTPMICLRCSPSVASAPNGSPIVSRRASERGRSGPPNTQALGYARPHRRNDHDVDGNWFRASTRTSVAFEARVGHWYCAAKMITR